MVLDQDLRSVTDINTYEAACWPSFVLEIVYASSDGVTCYTCYCIMYIDKCYAFWHQKMGGDKRQAIVSPPLQKVGGLGPWTQSRNY